MDCFFLFNTDKTLLGRCRHLCNQYAILLSSSDETANTTPLKSPTHLSSEDAGNNNSIPCTVIVSLSLVRFPPFFFFFFKSLLNNISHWTKMAPVKVRFMHLCVGIVFFSLECISFLYLKKNNLCTTDED